MYKYLALAVACLIGLWFWANNKQNYETSDSLVEHLVSIDPDKAELYADSIRREVEPLFISFTDDFNGSNWWVHKRYGQLFPSMTTIVPTIDRNTNSIATKTIYFKGDILNHTNARIKVGEKVFELPPVANHDLQYVGDKWREVILYKTVPSPKWIKEVADSSHLTVTLRYFPLQGATYYDEIISEESKEAIAQTYYLAQTLQYLEL